MKREILRLDRAKRDLLNHYVFIGRDSPSAADRLLVNAQRTFALLAEMPGAGRAWRSREPRLRNVRVFPVVGFRNYLVFYRAEERTLTIVRVLHGARDLRAALREDS
jgi:toxin ParE1/3/4